MQDSVIQNELRWSGEGRPGAGDTTRLSEKQQTLTRRARILAEIRCFFLEEGFLEIETPIRIPAPAPERHIDAEPAGEHYLITSPELQMKRMLQAGYPRIFQLCRCFRRGERGHRHLPEFTMLEWYRLEATPEALMRDCEVLVRRAAVAAVGAEQFRFGEAAIDAARPFERITVADAFERLAGWRPGPDPDADRFDRDLVDKVEPGLPRSRPVFLTDYPASLASLACLKPGAPEVSERFELYIGGMEIANGFGELTCPVEQRRRFEAERAARRSDGRDVYPLDERFLGALERGLPPSAGIALGVDRLVMAVLDRQHIDDVVAFPEGEL